MRCFPTLCGANSNKWTFKKCGANSNRDEQKKWNKKVVTKQRTPPSTKHSVWNVSKKYFSSGIWYAAVLFLCYEQQIQGRRVVVMATTNWLNEPTDTSTLYASSVEPALLAHSPLRRVKDWNMGMNLNRNNNRATRHHSWFKQKRDVAPFLADLSHNISHITHTYRC